MALSKSLDDEVMPTLNRVRYPSGGRYPVNTYDEIVALMDGSAPPVVIIYKTLCLKLWLDDESTRAYPWLNLPTKEEFEESWARYASAMENRRPGFTARMRHHFEECLSNPEFIFRPGRV